MSADQIRAAWNVAELVIEELVTAAEGLSGASQADKEKFVEAKAKEAVAFAMDHQHFVEGATKAMVQRSIEWALHLIIPRVWARVAPKVATAA